MTQLTPIQRTLKKIFPEQIKAKEESKCPNCKQLVNRETLKDELSKKEFDITGLCQKCQDKFFE